MGNVRKVQVAARRTSTFESLRPVADVFLAAILAAIRAGVAEVEEGRSTQWEVTIRRAGNLDDNGYSPEGMVRLYVLHELYVAAELRLHVADTAITFTLHVDSELVISPAGGTGKSGMRGGPFDQHRVWVATLEQLKVDIAEAWSRVIS